MTIIVVRFIRDYCKEGPAAGLSFFSVLLFVAPVKKPVLILRFSAYRKEICEAEDKAAKTQEKIDEYEEAYNFPYRAAQRGYIDAVIIPGETRMRLVDAMEAMRTKTEFLPAKKHGNIPVVVIEAMKMMKNIDPTVNGMVKEIKFEASDSVSKGDVLMVIEPES